MRSDPDVAAQTRTSASLQQLLDSLTGEVRGIAMRVERANGTTVEGIFEPHRKTPGSLSLFLAETQAYVDIPHDDVRRVWLPHVVKSRHIPYLASAAIVGVLVGVVSVRLTGSSATPGVLIGIATWLTIMLLEWLPAVRNWIVVWQLRYDAADLRS